MNGCRKSRPTRIATRTSRCNTQTKAAEPAGRTNIGTRMLPSQRSGAMRSASSFTARASEGRSADGAGLEQADHDEGGDRRQRQDAVAEGAGHLPVAVLAGQRRDVRRERLLREGRLVRGAAGAL